MGDIRNLQPLGSNKVPLLEQSKAGPKYEKKVRDALVRRHIEDGLGWKQLAELAAEGKLIEGVEPLHIPANSIRSIVIPAVARAWQDGGITSKLAKEPAAKAVGELSRRLLTILEFEINKMGRKQAQGKMAARDPVELAKGLKEILSMSKATGIDKAAGDEDEGEPETEPLSPFTAELLGENGSTDIDN